MAYIYVMHPKNRLRELRKRAGITQAELARKSGVSQPAISQLENDERPLTIDWMRTFARVFGVTAADLLDDEDNPHRLDPEEIELVQNFRQAEEQQRQMVKRVAEPLTEFRHSNVQPIRKNR
ncbi:MULTISPECIES: helix-turn-helix domain-containing protein [unclassified Novosphingobium]|uniref:helix-turn-helix domain-containing protein n=1 Tax=unclassified Novosphingobium TaxID=2644732 RepID=UPI000D311107|nr:MULTISPECIES: helix-turn-helix transcriptional regulator [unclassified Novosphingobium]PTR07888.1 DNA-binding XRE family transcriptional regulator [Novosphingobium sp. GV055]PUB00701.1 DNA-binding XRE family transcriptional regulator [Novosphingobium sp. GV061]PUB16110.1 DNA-binding XRE family transcriptional regulator [Novosphingobium sp. GV079]PUB39575.1 DNA-binding XRE family transcriptional regulator [Novosphingobium sp. GV027]